MGFSEAVENTPGGIRTHGLRFRKPTLYPAELRGRVVGVRWVGDSSMRWRVGKWHGGGSRGAVILISVMRTECISHLLLGSS